MSVFVSPNGSPSCNRLHPESFLVCGGKIDVLGHSFFLGEPEGGPSLQLPEATVVLNIWGVTWDSDHPSLVFSLDSDSSRRSRKPGKCGLLSKGPMFWPNAPLPMFCSGVIGTFFETFQETLQPPNRSFLSTLHSLVSIQDVRSDGHLYMAVMGLTMAWLPAFSRLAWPSSGSFSHRLSPFPCCLVNKLLPPLPFHCVLFLPLSLN